MMISNYMPSSSKSIKKFSIQTWILQMIFGEWPRKIWLGHKDKIEEGSMEEGSDT